MDYTCLKLHLAKTREPNTFLDIIIFYRTTVLRMAWWLLGLIGGRKPVQIEPESGVSYRSANRCGGDSGDNRF